MLTQPMMRALLFAGASFAMLLAGSPVRADELLPGPYDGWTFSAQSPFGFTSGGGAPGSFYYRAAPGAAFGAGNGTRGFADYSVAHGLSLGRELGIGNTQATFGVRAAEPLVGNGVAPALEQRRYLGFGPRVGLQGANQLKSSWAVEWQVGAALLYGDRTPDVTGGAAQILPSYGAGNSSVLNVDGLLGLSYWFNAASKLTLGYRADYLKGTPTFGAFGTAAQNADRLDHGPVIKFTIQK